MPVRSIKTYFLVASNFEGLTFLEVSFLMKNMAKSIFFVKHTLCKPMQYSNDLVLFRLVSLSLVRPLVLKAGVELPVVKCFRDTSARPLPG